MARGHNESSDEEPSFRRTRKRVSYNEPEDHENDENDDFDDNPSNTDEVTDKPPIRAGDEDDLEEPKQEEQHENNNEIEEVDEDEDEPPSSPEPEDKEEDYVDDGDDEDYIGRRKRKRSHKKAAVARKIGSDDSDFKADSGEEEDGEEDVGDSEDEYMDKLREKNFVAPEDDDNDDFGYSASTRRSGGRRRHKKSRSVSIEPKILRGGRTTRGMVEQVEVEDDDDEDDSIQKEVQDLYDSSPEASPIKHKLRERMSKVDYTIPPPFSADQVESYANGSAGGTGSGGYLSSQGFRRGRRTVKNDYRKLLFPTAGPFGGSDVISLFGTNIPPGGIPVEGAAGTDFGFGVGGGAKATIGSDSDSSDEDIGGMVKGGDANATINHTKLITSGTSAGANKKKNTLSDTDPLGVDMNIDFSVVGGLENYINQLKEMVALPLLYPELYQNFGLTPPRGVLFHGPPGTGKTLMARALAASCSTAERKITFFMRKGADCLSKWVGEAERQLRLLFEEAKNQQPSIIFFDEIDGLAPVRSLKQEQIHASIVSTLLALMDGMDNRGQVIVIGATNRPDSVDPALRRPGRFDREFYFPLPDLKARLDILKIHTRKWQPPLRTEFLDKVAGLTKGYGGADLRALCTEAALNSIQRKYPQIYKSDDKLKVNPKSVKVIARDFMKAVEKIVPSSARSTSSGSSPLPEHLRSLLEPSFLEVKKKLEDLLPSTSSLSNKTSALEEALYFDPTINDADGGFAKQELLRNLENSRICKPHLLICGEPGNGQQYISAAILNHLEGFQVQSLDMGNLFGDSTRTPELGIVQAFIEARRHQPSVIFIPNIDIWYQVVPQLARATLLALLRTLNSNEKILLLGVAETTVELLDGDIKYTFGSHHANSSNSVTLHNPTRDQRTKYFETLRNTLLMKPFEFTNDLENRPKRKLKVLPKVKVVTGIEDAANDRKKQKLIDYQDTKLKNVLKLKLAGLMDLFKNRYKRFKKPIIDESLLIHLFQAPELELPPLYEILYVKSTDPKHENMIREVMTGRYYYNMDLDIVEERLWNGFYSEPKQFIKDIKMIVKDSITQGDRERVLKANEMLTNAQFGVDDFSTPEFLSACSEMRGREIIKQEKMLEEHKKVEAEFLKSQKLKQVAALPPIVIEHNGEHIPMEVDATDEPDQPIEVDFDEETKVAFTDAEEKKQPKPNGRVFIGDLVHNNGTIEPHHQPQNSEIADVAGLAGTDSTLVSATDSKALELAPAIASTPLIFQTSTAPSIPPAIVANTLPLVPITDIVVDTPSPDGKAAEPEDVEEEESAESEIEELHHPDQKLTLDGRLDEFFDNLLPELTDNYGIEKLEIVMAKFMEIAWADRSQWDRRETILKLVEAARQFSLTLN